MSLYIASNIVLFALVAGSTEPANCGLATVVMWICGSYCEWNKHHEEEAWPDFCSSLLLSCSLHPSGYIQEGQGVSYDYLLLGVCYRNSTSSTGVLNLLLKKKYIYLSGLTCPVRVSLWNIRPMESQTSSASDCTWGLNIPWLKRQCSDILISFFLNLQ